VRFNDAITGAVLVVFAVAEIAYTRTFPSLHGQAYGPDLFPMLIGVGLFGCGCVLILRGLLARREQRMESGGQASASWLDLSNVAESSNARLNAALVVLFLVLYIVLSDFIGFIPISFITISTLLYRLGSSLISSCVIAIIATAVIQFLFAKILLVPLPAGWMQGLVW